LNIYGIRWNEMGNETHNITKLTTQLAISAGRMNAESTADRIIFKISSKACPRLHLTLLYYFSKQGGMNP
jgi:hypothetical protein